MSILARSTTPHRHFPHIIRYMHMHTLRGMRRWGWMLWNPIAHPSPSNLAPDCCDLLELFAFGLWERIAALPNLHIGNRWNDDLLIWFRLDICQVRWRCEWNLLWGKRFIRVYANGGKCVLAGRLININLSLFLAIILST